MKIAAAQIAPVFLRREATLEKVIDWIGRAAADGCALVCFGETLVPGYPVWLERADAARFEADDQKRLHARYLREAVCVEEGHLDTVCAAARTHGVSVVLGVAERPLDRGGHSVYASRVFIDAQGRIGSVHRKLMPTHEERLCWSIGDGAGLVTHRVGAFTLGALNCWENWMPLARAALYAQGMDLHCMLWPGADGNTRDITRFAAREGRSYAVSASAILRGADIPADTPERERFVAGDDEILRNGGSCIADPGGAWVVEPVTNTESLVTAELDFDLVLRERQSFDPVGHYSRPDALRIVVDRTRQSTLEE